ncbi:MAG TPA: aldose 1-epimerase family protein [Gemmatales bacterium]|nr:aldose 1-epimerase family protein [Gemmatales bacterium]
MSSDTVQFVLTDTVHGDKWLESWNLTSQQLPGHHPATPWKIAKRTLYGGKRHGVDLIELDNGALQLSILPTRGMNIWRGKYKDIRLGWDAPIHGPVHPQWIRLEERDGLGWLDGFDEWICRCGLANNGPPGNDGGKNITLHGRIANTPAHFVGVRVLQTPPYTIEIVGRLQEASMFGDQLHLTTVLSTAPGSNQFSIHDLVENRSSKVAEIQMLYHCNFGKPLLGPGSKVKVPAVKIAPRDARAAQEIGDHETYAGPQSGYSEVVNYYEPRADAQGNSLAVLHNAAGNAACAVRYNTKNLPWFIVWKNTTDEKDGYVTGLEPATGFPNFKTVERHQNRVVQLASGAIWDAKLTFQIESGQTEVNKLLAEAASLQGMDGPVLARQPDPFWTGTAGK